MNLNYTQITLSIIIVFTIFTSSVAAESINGTVTVISPNTTSLSSTSSSSDNFFGLGIISNEPLPNVLCADRSEKDWRYNIPITYTFKCDDIYEISINPTKNEFEIMLKTESLKSISNKTPNPPTNLVYKYTNIYSGSKRFNKSIIRFKVNTSWLSDKQSITLLKWNGEAWIPLETKEISSDTIHKYYESYTDSFSNFAIVGTPLFISTLSPTLTTTPELVSSPTTIIEPTEPTSTPTMEEQIAKRLNGFEILLSLLIIIIIANYKSKR